MKDRAYVVDDLKAFLIDKEEIYAIWEGGSSATNRLDEYSDLDLMMIVEQSKINALYDEIDQFFEEHFGIKHAFRVKEPAWHGFSQKFYELDGTTPYFYIDCVMMHKDQEDKFIAPDRHGSPTIWVDKLGLIKPVKTSNDEINQKVKQFYHMAIDTEFVTRLEIEKAFMRKHFLDASVFGYSYLSRHIGILLNIKYRKEKVDFGLRYAKNYFSLSDLELIDNFFKAHDLDTLKPAIYALFNRFNVLKEELKI